MRPFTNLPRRLVRGSAKESSKLVVVDFKVKRNTCRLSSDFMLFLTK
jgi:hypothetical protein